MENLALREASWKRANPEDTSTQFLWTINLSSGFSQIAHISQQEVASRNVLSVAMLNFWQVEEHSASSRPLLSLAPSRSPAVGWKCVDAVAASCHFCQALHPERVFRVGSYQCLALLGEWKWKFSLKMLYILGPPTIRNVMTGIS